MVTLYGIPNCDMVKKAIAWLKNEKVQYKFHNFQTDGISKEKLREWINIAGVDVVINKRSTTWRNLPNQTQMTMADTSEAIKVAMVETSIIKRPVLQTDTDLLIGFNEEEYRNKLML